MMATLVLASVLCAAEATAAPVATVRVRFDGSLRAAPWGAQRLSRSLVAAGFRPELAELAEGDAAAEVVLGGGGSALASPEHGERPEGSFHIVRTDAGSLHANAADGAGVMYAALELAERLDTARLQARGEPLDWAAFVRSLPTPLAVEPRFDYRALKFNLPWSAYRPGNATVQNYATVRNLTFWASFLDMMAENRYNVITLWALHPWAYMVKPTNFPAAASFGDTLHWGGPPDNTDTQEDWKRFWSGLFKLAKDRAIDPYVIDWNIFQPVGYKKAYDSSAITDHDGSGGDGTHNPQADRYQREVITQAINEYPDMAGIGVTLGERMVRLT